MEIQFTLISFTKILQQERLEISANQHVFFHTKTAVLDDMGSCHNPSKTLLGFHPNQNVVSFETVLLERMQSEILNIVDQNCDYAKFD